MRVKGTCRGNTKQLGMDGVLCMVAFLREGNKLQSGAGEVTLQVCIFVLKNGEFLKKKEKSP